MNNILSYTCINYTYAVVSIAKPTDPCFSEELEEFEEQPVRFVKSAYLMQWETITFLECGWRKNKNMDKG